MPASLGLNEYRRDPFSDAWVLISTDRAARPEEFRPKRFERVPQPCPFCRGNESSTPPQIACYPPGATDADWQVRVVPNKFPAVVTGDYPDWRGSDESNEGDELFCGTVAYGIHDLIVESPDHVVSFTDLTPEQAQWLFVAYRDRMAALAAEGKWSYAQAFKNVGPAAGSSVEHAHSQMVTLPQAPQRVIVELEKSAAYFRRHRRSIFSDLIEKELQFAKEAPQDSRVVCETDDFLALCPYASRVPYETWVIPKFSGSHFDKAKDGQLAKLARVMHDVIGRIERALGQPAYNYVIHTAPFDTPVADHYHWHIEIFPRMTTQAGFELGAGHFINPVSPESAALELRQA
jgi:UDPglucose--hexose-1-phosphate uridylyltransferase